MSEGSPAIARYTVDIHNVESGCQAHLRGCEHSHISAQDGCLASRHSYNKALNKLAAVGCFRRDGCSRMTERYRHPGGSASAYSLTPVRRRAPASIGRAWHIAFQPRTNATRSARAVGKLVRHVQLRNLCCHA